MGLLRKWRKKRELRYIPSELIYEPLYKTLRFSRVRNTMKMIKEKIMFSDEIFNAIKIKKLRIK